VDCVTGVGSSAGCFDKEAAGGVILDDSAIFSLLRPSVLKGSRGWWW